jgi:hypothetical protein
MTRLPVALALGLLAACAPAHVLTTPAPFPAADTRIRYSLRADTTRFTTALMVSLDADSLRVARFVPDLSGRPDQRVVTAIPTDSVARLQAHVGRRAHVGRGLLFGGLAGAALGALCASDADHSWANSTEGCLAGATASGLLAGLMAGALIRSNVWAPVALPLSSPR